VGVSLTLHFGTNDDDSQIPKLAIGATTKRGGALISSPALKRLLIVGLEKRWKTSLGYLVR
jgi:hypothetical protein